MVELSGQTVTFFGLAALVFVSYCIYFDHKRRTDPQYKRLVHERRQRRLQKNTLRKSPLSAEVVEYFLRQVYLGETCVRSKDWDSAVHYFVNAITLCADPNILLCKLQTAVPVELYDNIIAKVRLLVSTSDQQPRGQLSSSASHAESTESCRTCATCSSELHSD
ncbi:hypothetical protein AWZ03_014552 [Drosophila navojoa]|uniref:Mitochondrial import receptor subunit TOM20 homolog B n=1 Tax=Drosophila navojoa TaxID=7232 RepID=A0A484ARG5_DRONA|nr:mitochondrial import receptor subunit TOM20 homolog B-like [Drosophila navojoa]TDG39026.1 hypothetical protein AWZ03_014552 [Drosophila navojoa]